MKNTDKIFMRDAIRRIKSADEEVWRTSEEGHHFKIESETGEIKAGFGGKFNGQKVDPSKKKSSGGSSAKSSSATSAKTASNTGKTASGTKAASPANRTPDYQKQLRNEKARLERMEKLANSVGVTSPAEKAMKEFSKNNIEAARKNYAELQKKANQGAGAAKPSENVPTANPAGAAKEGDIASLESAYKKAQTQYENAKKAYERNDDFRKSLDLKNDMRNAEMEMRRAKVKYENAQTANPVSGSEGTPKSKRDVEKTLTDINKLSRKSDRIAKVPEFQKELDDMPAGSVITAVSNRGVREDYTKGTNGEWTRTMQGFPSQRGTPLTMSSDLMAENMLGTKRDDTRVYGITVRKNGSTSTRKYDSNADAKELQKLLPDATQESSRGKAVDIMESVPVGTYLKMKQANRTYLYKKTDEGTWENAKTIGHEKYGSGEVALELQTPARFGGSSTIELGNKEILQGTNYTK